MTARSLLERLGIARLSASVGVLLVGAGATVWLAQPPPPPVVEVVPIPELRVAGKVIDNATDPVGQALDIVRKFGIGAVKLKLPDGTVVEVPRSDFGLEIDRLRLSDFIQEARRPKSVIARARASAKDVSPIEVPLPLRIDAEKAISSLVDLKAKVDKPAQDAAIDLEARKIRPEQIGYRLDVYGTLAHLEAAFRAGSTEIEVAVEKVLPKRTAAQLENVKFDAVLGYFETRYSNAKKDEHRSYNLRLAANQLDGLVLMPGEEFDFNGVVGPRDEAHGFRVAPVIAQGELVDGIGGGTCQISGTLHAAAFFAGLEIVERYPHSRPSSYIKMGLDATVSYPNINYRFRNPFDFPVVLHEKVAGGTVRAEILGPERKLTVSYFRRIDDVLPFEEVARESDRLAKGERVVVQRGIPGFVATASRLVRDGAYGERTKWREKYPPTNQIVMVGTGPEDMEARVKEDRHSEYIVDEYLVITQSERSEAMSETRDPGRTGEPGWIKKLGLEKTPVPPGEDADHDVKGDPKSDDAKDDRPKGKKAKDKDAKKKGEKADDKGKKGSKSDKKPKKGGGSKP